MKKVLFIAAALVITFTAASQPQGQGPQGRPEGFPGGRPDFGGDRPPMGQGGPGGMGPGGPGGQGGRPPRGDGQFRGPRNEEMEKFMEKQNEKRDKEYSKILTPDQYQRWKSVETEREFRRMFE